MKKHDMFGVKTKTKNFFQVLGTFASVGLAGIGVFGVGQTVLPTGSGVDYGVITTTPLKGLIIGALGLVILVSFLVVIVINQGLKRGKK